MPDIDALNRALAEKLDAAEHDEIAWEPWTTCPECVQDDIRKPADCPRCGAEMALTPRAFCTHLNAVHNALNALGLVWEGSYYDGRFVAVGREGADPTDWSGAVYPDGNTPAALATALVLAALAVLEQKEEIDG